LVLGRNHNPTKARREQPNGQPSSDGHFDDFHQELRQLPLHVSGYNVQGTDTHLAHKWWTEVICRQKHSSAKLSVGTSVPSKGNDALPILFYEPFY